MLKLLRCTPWFAHCLSVALLSGCPAVIPVRGSTHESAGAEEEEARDVFAEDEEANAGSSVGVALGVQNIDRGSTGSAELDYSGGSERFRVGLVAGFATSADDTGLQLGPRVSGLWRTRRWVLVLSGDLFGYARVRGTIGAGLGWGGRIGGEYPIGDRVRFVLNAAAASVVLRQETGRRRTFLGSGTLGLRVALLPPR